MRTSDRTLDQLEEEKMDLTEVYTGDWKEEPETVLETVDAALEAHGLELEMIETGQDVYAFRIVERTGISHDPTAELAGDRIDWGVDR